jgi:hypothetical protein
MDISSGSRTTANNPGLLSAVAHQQQFENRIYWQLQTIVDNLICSSAGLRKMKQGV